MKKRFSFNEELKFGLQLRSVEPCPLSRSNFNDVKKIYRPFGYIDICIFLVTNVTDVSTEVGRWALTMCYLLVLVDH